MNLLSTPCLRLSLSECFPLLLDTLLRGTKWCRCGRSACCVNCRQPFGSVLQDQLGSYGVCTRDWVCSIEGVWPGSTLTLCWLERTPQSFSAKQLVLSSACPASFTSRTRYKSANNHLKKAPSPNKSPPNDTLRSSTDWESCWSNSSVPAFCPQSWILMSLARRNAPYVWTTLSLMEMSWSTDFRANISSTKSVSLLGSPKPTCSVPSASKNLNESSRA